MNWWNLKRIYINILISNIKVSEITYGYRRPSVSKTNTELVKFLIKYSKNNGDPKSRDNKDNI